MRHRYEPGFWLLICLLLMSFNAVAATFTVDDPVDGVDKNVKDGVCLTTSGTCTLRAAIQQANAITGSDTINIPTLGVYPLTKTGAGAGIQTGDLNITDDVTIAGATGVTIDGSAGSVSDRIFNIKPAKAGRVLTVSLTDLMLVNGTAAGNGGGIWSQSAALSLTDVAIVGCSAQQDGGAIYFDGRSTTATLMITGGRIFRNTAVFSGGGIYITAAAANVNTSAVTENTANLHGGGIYQRRSFGIATSLSLSASTVSKNIAMSNGGGIYDERAALTLVNTTIAGNGAYSDGGGIYHNDSSGMAPADFYSTTIAGNTADSEADGAGAGGGIVNNAGAVMLRNTILASNDDALSSPNCKGVVTSGGYNMTDDGSGCTMTATTGDTSVADVMLDEFSAWGGDTETYALEQGSPAIDAGDTSGCTDASGAALEKDQRVSYQRNEDGDGDGAARCDIGAYEYKPCDDSTITTYSYLMSFHACDTDCTNPDNHNIYLAGSDDGKSWSLIDVFATFSDSVAEIAYANDYLYVHTPGYVRRYDACFELVDESIATVTGATDGFVDPAVIVEGSETYLFYLPSGTKGIDPASCAAFPCTKEIRSASADDETLSTFTSVTGNRAEIYLATSGYASDPDVIALNDGTYLLYVSSGQDTLVFTGASLTDTFASPDGATDRKISDGQGGVPSAIQAPDGSIWLYVTTGGSGGAESIRMATSPDGITPLTSGDFATVINYTISPAFTASTYVSSPSIIAWPDSDWYNRSDE